MSKPSARQTVTVLLKTYGRSYASEAGIRLAGAGPSPLFRWLCTCLLLSARISAGTAIEASRALARKGWTTPQKLNDSTWADRARVLNQAGYARYDERTSTMLGDTAELLLERYKGDLRRMREEAGCDPADERRHLKNFKGIGETGADIFCREMQTEWEELYPFADKKTTSAASRLGLPGDTRSLARLVKKADFPLLLAALVRCDLDKTHADILDRAA